MRPTRPQQPTHPAMPAGPYAPPPVQPVVPLAPPVWREAPMQAAPSARLHCPKCHGELVTYERQGVHVEQCRDCRGIWLDRGELDRLIDSEASVGRGPGYPPLEPAWREPWDDDDDRGRRSWRDDDDDDDRRRRRDDDDDYPGRRPGHRRSTFGELFQGLIE